jgi:DNA primase
MGRFARRVVVNYDGDRAGVSAAKRAIETLLAEDFDIKVLVLPEGADPDSFIKAAGVEAYNERRGAALPHLQFVLDQAMRDRNLRRPADKAEAVEEVLPFVRAVRNRIQKREYFDMTMDALRVEEPALRRELWQTVSKPTVQTNGSGADASSSALQDKMVRAESAPLTVAEQRLLELLVHDAELLRILMPRIAPEDYEDLPTATVFRALAEIEAVGDPVDFSTLGARTEADPIAADLVPLLLMSEPEARAEGEAMDDLQAEAESCLLTLRLMRIERRLKDLAIEIAAAERAGDNERRDALVMENLTWTRRRSALLPRN